jgi:crotonobetainyl-CoA:carnitine CoA-transferase CaiB-like acyl-CoA transferase
MKLLSGIRVIELGLWVAGPAAAGILADWGAEVIKIEMPSGDPMRRLFGALSGSREERCPPFDLYNRGKRSIALDINTVEGVDLVRRLISSADVFLTNMRPQFLQRVGLDSATLLAARPDLIYASLTAYGLEGPDRDAPGYDMAAFSGRSGIAERATPQGAAPPILPGGIGDNVSALSLVAGIAGALFHRERTGQGQLVSTSLLRNGVYGIGMDVSTRLGLGRIAPAQSRLKPQNPLMNVYQAQDDRWFWLIGAESERHWPGILAATGLEDLAVDTRFATPRDRRRHGTELVAIFDQTFASKPRDDWGRIFVEHDVWWAPVQSVDELVCDPQAIASGAFVSVPAVDGDAYAEVFNSVATPIDFSATPAAPAGPPPAIGADTEALLDSLGVDRGVRERLRQAGVLAARSGAHQ